MERAREKDGGCERLSRYIEVGLGFRERACASLSLIVGTDAGKTHTVAGRSIDRSRGALALMWRDRRCVRTADSRCGKSRPGFPVRDDRAASSQAVSTRIGTNERRASLELFAQRRARF